MNLLKESIKSGVSFGITSSIITTLGLMVGLSAGTNSKLAVIGGVLTIAFADAFSDALGIHMSQESENHHTQGEIWEATFATFIAKVIFASSFLVPLYLLDLTSAVAVSVAWGMLLITLLSLYLAKEQKIPSWRILAEHLSVVIIVIIASSILGNWIRGLFK